VVLHADELAYAYVVRLDSLSERRAQAEIVGKIFVQALRRLGVAAAVVATGTSSPSLRSGPATCCASLSEHEIMVDGKKIMGRAFRDKSGYRLEQGFLLLGDNRPDLREFLPKPDPEMAAQAITVEATGGKKVAFEHLAALLYKEACLITGQIWQYATLTPEDEERIGQLVKDKYGNAEWLNKF
jgi:lipoate-protein ligase A